MQKIQIAAALATLSLLSIVSAQPGGRGPQRPVVVSPEVQADGRVTFRVNAPLAQSARRRADDERGERRNGKSP